MAITIQSGLTSLTSDSLGITITRVDRSRAFILISATTDAVVSSTGCQNWLVTGYLTNGDTLTIQREGSTVNANVAWQVVTCDEDEFYVVRGQDLVNSGNTSATENITAIDLTRTMVIYSCRGDFDTSTTNLGFGSAVFNSNTQLGFERGGSSTTRTYINYEVVEWAVDSGVSVTAGYTTVSTDASSGVTAAHGATVTTSDSWLYCQSAHESNGLEQCAMRATFDATNVTMDRYDSTSTYVSKVAWQLVTFPEDICAQYTDEMASGDSSESTPVTAVTLANAMIWGTNNCNGTGTAFGRNALTHRFTTTTNAASTRSYTGQACQTALSVVDFSGWNYTKNIQFFHDI